MQPTCDRAEVDPVGADPHVVGRVAGVQGKFGRRRGQAFRDQPAVDPHPLARGGDVGAGAAKDVARFGVQEIHADLLQHPERGVMDHLYLFGVQHLDRRQRVVDRAARQLLDRRAVARRAPAGTSTGHAPTSEFRRLPPRRTG